MIRRNEELGLPRTGVPLLRDLIHDRMGLFYGDDRCDTLCERLAPVVVDRGFRSFLDLYYLLKYEADDADWAHVMDALSVPETYFWREMDQIRAVVCHVVPKLVAANGHHPLRIWSSVCASGEEPLTLAIALTEAGWFDRTPIEIHASDGSRAAIEKARAGVYRDRSFRTMPPHLKEKYFVRAEAGFEPIASVRARIATWNVVNLVDPQATFPFVTSPIVFCRNAFIYFSQAAIRRVVEMFANGMPRPGYLCIGASESLLNVTTAFTLEEIDGAFVYVKP